MKVKVTQSEEAIVRLVSLMSYEKPTHVSIETWERKPDVKTLAFSRKSEEEGFEGYYNVVNAFDIDPSHFPTLKPGETYKISDLEVPDEWKSIE